MLRILALGALLIATTACSGTRAASSPFEAGEADASAQQTLSVRVFNNAFEDATVYALSGSRRIRAGMVSGKGDRTLDFRWPMTTTWIRFEIEFLAGPTCITDELPVSPGEILELQLPADPGRSRGCA